MKVAICDSTQEGVKTWKRHLHELEQTDGIRIELSHYPSTEALLFNLEDPELRPDLLLLDVQMPGLNGIAAAQKIREMRWQMEIIFLTENPRHWPEAFDVEAIHYLIKGQVASDRMQAILHRAVRRIGERQEKHFVFSCAGQEQAVLISSVRYFSVEDHITTVHYFDEDGIPCKFEFYTSISKLENSVFSYGFVRVHKSHIVSLRYLKSISTYSGAVLEDGLVIPVGRAYYNSARAVFEEYQERTA